jgi:hypothetical protein
MTNLNDALSPSTVNSGVSASANVVSSILSAIALLRVTGDAAGTAADATVAALTNVGAGLGKVASGLGSIGAAQVGGAVSAVAGQAGRVGALSVPSSWGTLTSAVGRAAPQALSISTVGATGDAGMPPPVGLAGAPGSMAAGTGSRGGLTPQREGTTLRTLMRPTMLPRPQYIG